MTILPELRDALARTQPPVILPELRAGLAKAPRPRPAWRRRPALSGGLALGGLLVATGALAATGVIPIGPPVEPHRVQRDPERGAGVPVRTTARLLGLRVADPAGGPPWGLRLVETSRGLTCLQLGRLVDGRLGVLGKDGLQGGDGRFHPLPLATASGPFRGCMVPDGAGRVFTATEWLTYASGDTFDRGISSVRSCRVRGERGSRPACPAADERRVSYGLLGPQATRVAYTDGSTQALDGDLGAYLHVRAGPGLPDYVAGGGPFVNGFGSSLVRIDYRDGSSCPQETGKSVVCRPRGETPRPIVRAPAATTAAPLSVRIATRRIGTAHRGGRTSAIRARELRVRFRAPVAITDARRMYLLEARFPHSPRRNCRSVVAYVPTDRNIAVGAPVTVETIVPRECTGVLRARVLLADVAYRDGKPRPAVVGRFERRLAR